MTAPIEQSHYVVLKKLQQLGTPMNMLEIGFTATPQVIRNMAARGMIRVTVELCPRGAELLHTEIKRRLRNTIKVKQAQRLSGVA